MYNVGFKFFQIRNVYPVRHYGDPLALYPVVRVYFGNFGVSGFFHGENVAVPKENIHQHIEILRARAYYYLFGTGGYIAKLLQVLRYCVSQFVNALKGRLCEQITLITRKLLAHQLCPYGKRKHFIFGGLFIGYAVFGDVFGSFRKVDAFNDSLRKVSLFGN